MIGRPYTSGSLTDAAGGVRAYLHIKRLRKLAAAHPEIAAALNAAGDAMTLLANRNRKLGRDLGASLNKRLLTVRGASLSPDCPDTPAVIADLAGDAPVTAYVGRDRRRIRVTTRHDRLPRSAKVVGRYDETTDYRRIAADVARLTC